MPRRGLRFTLGIVGLALVGAAWLAWLTAPKHCIRAVAEKPYMIQTGINQDPVEAILGVPPGDYTTPGTTPYRPGDPNGEVPQWHSTADWFADQASVRVYFDADSRVLLAMGIAGAQENWWERVRRRNGL